MAFIHGRLFYLFLFILSGVWPTCHHIACSFIKSSLFLPQNNNTFIASTPYRSSQCPPAPLPPAHLSATDPRFFHDPYLSNNPRASFPSPASFQYSGYRTTRPISPFRCGCPPMPACFARVPPNIPQPSTPVTCPPVEGSQQPLERARTSRVETGGLVLYLSL